MILTCSICGKPYENEDICDISLTNDTIKMICNLVRKRVEKAQCA